VEGVGAAHNLGEPASAPADAILRQVKAGRAAEPPVYLACGADLTNY
jgi:hypothetical protein